MIGGLLKRELKLVARDRAHVFNPLAFMFLAVMLFAVATPAAGPGAGAGAGVGGAMLWVIVLLTTLLSLDGLFRRDFDNGVLEQWLCSAEVPFLVVLVRIAVQWVYTGALITVLAPVLALMLMVPVDAIPTVMASLLLGTPALSLLGAVGASVTVGFSRGGVILALLILPLFVPVLIFGAGAIHEAVAGSGSTAQLYWLAFISMVALTIGPFAATAGLRISVQLQ